MNRVSRDPGPPLNSAAQSHLRLSELEAPAAQIKKARAGL